jgi:hypothetical protein
MQTMTRTETAAALGITQERVTQLLATDKLEGVMVDYKWEITAESVRREWEKRTVNGRLPWSEQDWQEWLQKAAPQEVSR